MKKQKAIEILILILVFLGLILSVVLIKHYKFDKPNTYNIIFLDADSLVKGSPVRFMGINAGHVEKLKMKDKYIICRIRITKKGVKIPDGTRAKVAFNGLGGSKSVELLPPLTDDPEAKGIVAMEALRINDIAGMLRSLVDVVVMIDNFVQEIDPVSMMDTFNTFTNPEIIDRMDNDIDKIIKAQAKSAKNTEAKGNFLLDFMKRFER